MWGVPQVNERSLLRFLAKIEFSSTGCWLWTAAVNGSGYASFGTPTESMAHRVSYSWFVGPIPCGYVMDHLCRVRHCVNPDHLEAVTPQANVLRGRLPVVTRNRLTREVCQAGHVFDGANTGTRSNGNKRCRACSARYSKDYRRRKATTGR